jgi:hypothetical protein
MPFSISEDMSLALLHTKLVALLTMICDVRQLSILSTVHFRTSLNLSRFSERAGIELRIFVNEYDMK